MIIKDVVIRSVNRWKGGNIVVSFLIKPDDMGDLANRLVLESYVDDNTPLTIAITKDATEDTNDGDTLTANDLEAIHSIEIDKDGLVTAIGNNPIQL